MKIILVRHADPDYSIDSLTETGFAEATALRERMLKIPAAANFVSPLGRALKTAQICLEGTGNKAETLDWLREFAIPVKKPKVDDLYNLCVWDWLPADWSARPLFYDKDKWMLEPELAEAGVPEAYANVTENLDRLLQQYGYIREGLNYRADRANHDTIVMYCHFGLECVLLSHLINVSPMILWHGTCSAPSGVTTVVTEEREEGIASWRMTDFGDVSHLYVKDMEPSFHARFCECFTDGTRH